MDRLKPTLEAAGFIHRKVSVLSGKGQIEMFIDGPDAKVRDAVHLIFAGEKVTDDSLEASPEVDAIDPTNEEFKLVDLEALITMKLTSFLRKDQVHLLDMIEIGQLNETWLERVPSSLRGRLQELLDDPDG